MNQETLIQKIKTNPLEIQFSEIIAFIDENYDFTPTKFTNGKTVNDAGQNSGSCKLFSFAKINQLSKEETLACFGDYFHKDVVLNPEGIDHQNIRNFIQFGWEGIIFEGNSLAKKI